MSILVTCSCGARLPVPAESAGRQVRCAACRRVLLVPAAPSPASAPARAPATPASGPDASGPNYRRWALIGGVASVLAFGVFMAIVFLVAHAIRQGRQAAPQVAVGPAAESSPVAEDRDGPGPAHLGGKILAGDGPAPGKKPLADDALAPAKKPPADDAAAPAKKNLADDDPAPNQTPQADSAPSPATKPLEREAPPAAGQQPPKPSTKPSEPERKPNVPPLGPAPNQSTEVTFLNTTAKGQRFCIIADNSGSMTGEPMAFVKRELAKTLKEMKPESQFYVMFFNTVTEPMPFDGWLNGRPEDVRKVNGWVEEKVANGGTEPLPAFVRAFELDPRPDVIFFMTDGLIPLNVPAAVAALNARRPKVTIHTIMFTSDQPPALGAFMPAIAAADLELAARLLRKIADDSGGTYRLFTPWTPEDLAKAAEAGDEKRLAEAINYLPRMMPEARRVIPRLLGALRKAPEGVRALLFAALGKMGPTEPAHLPALLTLLEEPDEPLQLFALAALAPLRDKARDAVAPLRTLFDASDKSSVQLAILQVLRQIVGSDRTLIDLYRDRGLKKKAEPVRLASLAALREIGGGALPFRLLTELSFEDASAAMRRAARAILAERMKAIDEGGLADARTLLRMKANGEAVQLGLLGVTKLGPKAKDCLPETLEAFTGEDDAVCKASVPALRAMGPAARPALDPLAARLADAPPKRQMEIALVLVAIDPTDARVVRAVPPLLVRNLHPNTLDKDGPPEMLLESIKVMGAPTVPLIFAALDGATGQRGAAAANHRKYLFLALERLGPVAYSEKNLETIRAFTSPKVELFADVRTAAGKARRAMTP